MTNDVYAQLEALYAELPTLECRGKCHAACQGISATYAENARAAERGYTIEFNEPAGKRCSALTMWNTCAIYPVRPMLCRLWGLAPSLQCSYGCRPTRFLTSSEIADFLLRSYAIGGHPHFDEQSLAATRAYLVNNPAGEEAYDQFIRTNANREVRDMFNYLRGTYGV